MPVSSISHRRPRSAVSDAEVLAFGVHSAQIPLRAVDGLRARGHAGARELGREHAVVRGQARVERLDHRPEILFETGRLGRGNRQRMASRSGVEPEQAAARRGGSDRAERGRAVPAVLVVTRVHRRPRRASISKPTT